MKEVEPDNLHAREKAAALTREMEGGDAEVSEAGGEPAEALRAECCGGAVAEGAGRSDGAVRNCRVQFFQSINGL